MSRLKRILTTHCLAALTATACTPRAPTESARPKQDRRVLGVYYQPSPKTPAELQRVIEGDPGGRQAFTHAMAAVVRFERAGTREVWRDYLAAAARVGRGRFRCVFDVHVLANDEWLTNGRFAGLMHRMLESEHADLIGGWYVCDEALGRSIQGRKNPVDLKPMWDLVIAIRSVAKQTNRPQMIYADYASVLPLLKRGGDPIKGGYADYTADPAQRAPFLWGGHWVGKVDDPRYNEGNPIVRGYGFFGEDVTMVNWWGDAAELHRWAPRILSELPTNKLHLGICYDWTPSTPSNNAKGLARTADVTNKAKELGVVGFWFWSWQAIDAGGKRYKGLREWWETAPGEEHARRYASLVESLGR